MTHPPQSPYLRALGDLRAHLHPILQEYFATIPDGHVGVGEGTFTRVGTPRRWLWPFLRPLQQRGIVLAGWEQDAPFRLSNHMVAGRLISDLTVALPGGEWTLRDSAALTPRGHLVNELGQPTTVAASFNIAVHDGGLTLTNRAVGMRLWCLRIRVPRFLSPSVRLIEFIDEHTQRQRIELTLDLPLFGRVYEHSGDFTYRTEKEQA